MNIPCYEKHPRFARAFFINFLYVHLFQLCSAYVELPNPRMSIKIGFNKINPIANPTPCPNAFDSLKYWIMEITATTIYKMSAIMAAKLFCMLLKIPAKIAATTHIQNMDGFQHIRYRTCPFRIGIIDFQPASPALVNIFHCAITKRT